MVRKMPGAVEDIKNDARFLAAIHQVELKKGYDAQTQLVSQTDHISSVVTASDLSRSDMSLNSGVPGREYVAFRKRPGYEASFSEEDDPNGPDGVPLRCHTKYNDIFVQLDPKDGTGDERYNLKNFSKAEGSSMLLSYIYGSVPFAGIIYLYPTNRMVLGDKKTGPMLFTVDGEEIHFEGPVKRQPVDLYERIRINYRPAYPDNDMLQFFDFLASKKKLPIEIVNLGGAGDALGNLILGNVDYVVTQHGNWKTWDTDCATGQEKSLKGSDLYGNPLVSTTRHRTPWHQQGNIFTIYGSNKYMAALVRQFEREAGLALRKDSR